MLSSFLYDLKYNCIIWSVIEFIHFSTRLTKLLTNESMLNLVVWKELSEAAERTSRWLWLRWSPIWESVSVSTVYNSVCVFKTTLVFVHSPVSATGKQTKWLGIPANIQFDVQNPNGFVKRKKQCRWLEDLHIRDNIMLPLSTASNIAILVVWLLLKVERRQGWKDDTALNGIRLLCRHTENRNVRAIIGSSEGK